MKNIKYFAAAAALVLALATPVASTATTVQTAGIVKQSLPFSGCYIYGKHLAGKVQVVTKPFGGPKDKIPTYKVQVVKSFQDLKVQVVTSFPDKCGKWKFVTAFPDFKIRYVTAFPDFKIKLVTAFPGR